MRYADLVTRSRFEYGVMVGLKVGIIDRQRALLQLIPRSLARGRWRNEVKDESIASQLRYWKVSSSRPDARTVGVWCP